MLKIRLIVVAAACAILAAGGAVQALQARVQVCELVPGLPAALFGARTTRVAVHPSGIWPVWGDGVCGE